MPYANPMKVHGYDVIAAASHVWPGEWRGYFTATKEGAATITQSSQSLFSSRNEAEQVALCLARVAIRRCIGW
jgi:hypothetical protein